MCYVTYQFHKYISFVFSQVHALLYEHYSQEMFIIIIYVCEIIILLDGRLNCFLPPFLELIGSSSHSAILLSR